MTTPDFSAHIQVCPSFNDTDPMGIVWHGNYAKFFERVREVLFRRFDYSYDQMARSGYAYPIIEMSVKYRHPWRLEELATVSVTLTEYENRLVTDYEVRALDGTLKTTARIVQLAIDLKTKEGLLQCPPVLFERLGVKPS